MMFGTFRFMLALLVVWYHLVDRQFAGPIAVFGFYCLSGYLMTRVVNETYADGLSGFGRYLANRALRIYPVYWFALGLGLAVIIVMPDKALLVSENFKAPAFPLVDLIIFGHRLHASSAMPQAWSLAVELVYYILIGALLGRRRFFTVGWFVFALVAVTAAAVHGGKYEFWWFYSSMVASSLPFATGAMIYHFRDRIPSMPIAIAVAAGATLLLAGLIMPRELGRSGGIYVGLVIAAIAIAALMQARPSRFDTQLGDLAYPMFLLHYPAGALALALTGEKGIMTGALTALIALPFCWLSIVLVERPVQALRARIRPPVTQSLLLRTSSQRSIQY
jgi:peptidoglycan/LPS O-acetylase OafA/YrhL